MLSSRALRCASRISTQNASAVISVRWFPEDYNLHSFNMRRCMHTATQCCTTRRQFINPFGMQQSVRLASSNEGTPSTDPVAANGLDPDNDVIDEYASYQPDRDLNEVKGRRVKVKFNWRNSLVTADAENLLESIYKTHPQLIDLNESELVDYLQRMSIYAFDVEKAAEMLLIYPRLINIPNERISSCITALRGIGLTESQHKSVLRRAPLLFDAPPKKLSKQFSFLNTYLVSSESIEILTKSVETFLESESTLKKKLEFLIKDMSHSTKSIVACKALSYPLLHMKTRHEFLIRAGLFKPIPYNKLIKTLEKDYKDRNKPREKYFRPLELVCYQDVDFLKVCTNDMLTLNELAAFEELYEKELIRTEEEMDDEDEEEDEYEEYNAQEAVSLIDSTNSQGFFNDAEGKSCYF